MATYFVASGGSNTSPYDTWAKAATSLQTALTAASSGTDTIVIQYNGVPSGDAEVSVATTYTTAANVNIISASADDTGTAYTPTAMGTSYWIGNSTTNKGLTVTSAYTLYMYGVTLRTAGTTTANISFGGASSDAGYFVLENCYLWSGNTNSASVIVFGGSSTNALNNAFKTINTTYRFGNTGSSISIRSPLEIVGGSISSSGSAPTNIFKTTSQSNTSVLITGMDLSHAGSGNIVYDDVSIASRYVLNNCKLGSGAVPMAAQTITNPSSAEVWLYNCSSGDNHYEFGHYNALGQTVAVTSPYVSDGALYDGTNHVAWKVTGTANCSFYSPYVSPWIETYHSGTSAITPSLEGLMIDDSTVAKNNEVWGEFSYQGTTGYTTATIVNDRMAFNGTAADQTSSKTYSDWTASPATDSGDSVFKLATTSTITPAEIGFLRARVCVGEASKTLYIDPKIRT